MPAIFGDHMVIQQEAGIAVWGSASPGETVTVTLGQQSAKAAASSDGKWRVDLKPVAPNSSPMTLTVEGNNRLEFQDVLVGEVWLCSGQSNMAVPFSKSVYAWTEASQVSDSQLRIFEIRIRASLQPQSELVGKWRLCDLDSLAYFSTVGYFFGKELREKLHRPVGLISAAWGGSHAQAWISLAGLQQPPAFDNYVTALQKSIDVYPQAKVEYPKLLAEYNDAQKRWLEEVGNVYNAEVKAWDAAETAARNAGKPLPPRPILARPAPIRPIQPDGDKATPTALFNGMIAPLIPYRIKGVIWYQGESNNGTVEYGSLFPRLITDWRAQWKQGDFPFLYVQLPNFHGPARQPVEGNWPMIREGQRKALALPHTGMAVTIDVGDLKDLHPPDKWDVAQRLALVARHVAYGEKIVYSGPLYESMQTEGSKVRVKFSEVGGGLVLGVSPWNPTGAPVPTPTELKGFAIAGADKKWVWAKASIEGDSVVVSSDEVPAPVAIRYGWSDTPPANLYNKEGLPASPFRTDDWQ